MIKILFIGASQLGRKCLQTVIQSGVVEVAGIVTAEKEIAVPAKKRKTKNVHYYDFDELARQEHIPILRVKKTMKEDGVLEFIRGIAPDLMLVIGWYLKLPPELLALPPLGSVGIHAGMLPLYRGGAPLVWAMINGEKEVGVSLFYFTEQLDAGDLLDQRIFPVYLKDTIRTVYERMERHAVTMLEDNIRLIADGRAKRVPQRELLETEKGFWPNRIPEDGLINWGRSALEIYNFIRAQTRPYPGAFTYYGNTKIHIWDCCLLDWEYHCESEGMIVGFRENNGLREAVVSTRGDDYAICIRDFSVEGQTDTDMRECVFFKAGEQFRSDV